MSRKPRARDEGPPACGVVAIQAGTAAPSGDMSTTRVLVSCALAPSGPDAGALRTGVPPAVAGQNLMKGRTWTHLKIDGSLAMERFVDGDAHRMSLSGIPCEVFRSGVIR